jgi:hypothetical protein
MSENQRADNSREPNRLIDCASPYLQQHAYNPVDWYPWCPEALERARREQTPILLSIGYSACHWCHVMERECFEDPEIARLMNENFINIKVDREERPDLDRVYMRAVQLMTGSGGWPLTVFLTPELAPFYGGTYFPPEDRGDRPGFPRVLRSVRDAWDRRRNEVDSTAHDMLEAINETVVPPAPEGGLSRELMEEALRSVVSRFDLKAGGLGTAQKFPQSQLLDWLLRHWHSGGDERPRLMLTMTLDNMQNGGLFDQLGGGFHRYTVDRWWRVPHFEKMLYDNAQLIGLYADAARAFGRDDYAETAAGAARYLLHEMRHPEGGFYSAQDADSEGEEGRYYAWTWQELMDCLGPEQGRVVASHFGATEAGNWEDGLNVLYRAVPPGQIEGVDEEEARRMIADGRRLLLEKRRERTAPEKDRKILADWNGLAMSGLTRLFRATGDERYLSAAGEAAQFINQRLSADGRLFHVWREGPGDVPGYLSDYALMAAGLLDLYECTFDTTHLRRARELADRIVNDFWDDQHDLLREVGPEHEEVIGTGTEMSDEPVASGISAACHVFLRLDALDVTERTGELAERMLRETAGLMERSPSNVGHLLSAALRFLAEPRELVLIESSDGELRRVADRCYLPHVTLAGASAGQAEEVAAEVPLLQGKEPAERPTAYLCSGGACRRPVHQPEELRQQLSELMPEN